jgi:hypothetical protein
MSCATLWTLLVVGRPLPMSRNCLMPASDVRYLTARPRNDRFSRAAMYAAGEPRRTCAAVSRSAAKWFFPPMR